MSITTLAPVTRVTPPTTAVAAGPPGAHAPGRDRHAPVIALDAHREAPVTDADTGANAVFEPTWVRHLEEAGAASAEYAAVTACGVGLAGVLLKLLTSEFGQNLLKTLIEFFLKMVGIG